MADTPEGTAVTVIQSVDSEEEDPDGGVAVKVLDVPSAEPPVLVESPRRAHGENSTTENLEQAEELTEATDSSEVKGSGGVPLETKDAKVSEKDERIGASEDGDGAATEEKPDDEEILDEAVSGIEPKDEALSEGPGSVHDEPMQVEDDVKEEMAETRIEPSKPELEDEDTIDSDQRDGSESPKMVIDESLASPESPKAKSESADELATPCKSSNDDVNDRADGNDADDEAQSVDSPRSPIDRRSSGTLSPKSHEVGSENTKMRGRLQKELRKLGVDTEPKTDEGKETEEEEKPTGRPSRNAARVAARKITNVVAKSNMSVESLVAMASDGEDYSCDGISTRFAQKKSPRKKLTYCNNPKALINDDLMMECIDCVLAPCQIDVFRNAVHSYNTITTHMQQISKRKLQVTFNNTPLTKEEFDSLKEPNKKDEEHLRLETVTSKVCRGGWNLVTVQPLGKERLKPNIVMTQSAPFADLPDEGENDMSRMEDEFAIFQLDTDPVPFLVKHKFLRPMGGTKNRLYSCECNVESKVCKSESALDGHVWKCTKCDHTWNLLRPEQTLFSWYAKIPLYKTLNVIKSWVLAHSCEETWSLTGVDTFIVRSMWRSIQELCHKDVVRRILPLGNDGDVVEVSAAHMDPFVVVAALDRKSNTFRAKVFSAVTTTEVDLARAASSWISPAALITTKSHVMRSTLVQENDYVKTPVLAETSTLDSLLLMHLSDHFGNFRLESSNQPILEGFLFEIEWRKAFGRFGPRESFWRMIAQLLPTFQEGTAFLSQVASQFVTPGGQVPLGIKQAVVEKRNTDDKHTVNDEEEEAVILENYYYAKRDGERYVQKHKKYIRDGEMFFRCPVCKKVAKNNISIMKHIIMHLESNREFNPDVASLSICRHCFRDFETPYDCQVHTQQVHLSRGDAERLCCKICSLGFSDEKNLVYHMKSTHTARDMPYVCKICHYRSSFKHHVINHFREKHSGCNALQCPYCLEMYYSQARQVVTGVQGNTKFYSHLFKHMTNSPKPCTQCSLPFIKQKELRMHKTECHNKSNTGKGKVMPCGWISTKPVIVQKPRKKPPSLPPNEKKGNESNEESGDGKVNWLIPSLRLPDEVEDYDCRECWKPITQEHFCRVLRCTECQFFTCCQSSFTGHMLKYHGQVKTIRKNFVSTPLLDNKNQPEKFVGRCKKCDEKFEDGNSLVKHLVTKCGLDDGATIELGKRKAAIKHTQVKRRRGAEPEGMAAAANKFEDVLGESFTEVFNKSSSNSVGSTPVKTNVPQQAKGNRASGEGERFLASLGLRTTESCSEFKVNLAGPKCVKQQWINMGLVQQEIESSSESEDENEAPEKKEKRQQARKERAQGLLPKNSDDEDANEEADSPTSSSSSDTSVTDVDLE